MKRIYIDCTDLYFSQLNTGIQRVERNIIHSAVHLEKKFELEIIPVIYLGKIVGLRKVKLDQQKYKFKIRYFDNIYVHSLKPNRLKILTQATFPFISNFINKSWSNIRFLMLPILIIIIPPISLLSFIFVLLKPRLSLKKNDIYFIPGSSWWTIDLSPLFIEIKKSGATISVLIHDIIAIEHSSFCETTIKKIFEKRLNHVLSNSNQAICVSNFTNDRLKNYIKIKNHITRSNIFTNYSGFKLDLVEDHNKVRDNLSVINNSYITIGTVEPRKNYDYLLKAFNLIWEYNKNITLCIIGRYGWSSDSLVENILSNPQYGRHLFWFNDLNDNELLYAYQHAKACVYPSTVEGFGLPLIEALSLRCPVLASDIPIFHEVGGDYCHYFSLDDPKQLSELIEKVESHGLLDNLSYLDSFSWPDWNESTTNLLKILNEL